MGNHKSTKVKLKLKTHRGAAKRFKVTATGDIGGCPVWAAAPAYVKTFTVTSTRGTFSAPRDRTHRRTIPLMSQPSSWKTQSTGHQGGDGLGLPHGLCALDFPRVITLGPDEEREGVDITLAMIPAGAVAVRAWPRPPGCHRPPPGAPGARCSF